MGNSWSSGRNVERQNVDYTWSTPQKIENGMILARPLHKNVPISAYVVILTYYSHVSVLVFILFDNCRLFNFRRMVVRFLVASVSCYTSLSVCLSMLCNFVAWLILLLTVLNLHTPQGAKGINILESWNPLTLCPIDLFPFDINFVSSTLCC